MKGIEKLALSKSDSNVKRAAAESYCKHCRYWVPSLTELFVNGKGWLDLCHRCKNRIERFEETKIYNKLLNKVDNQNKEVV